MRLTNSRRSAVARHPITFITCLLAAAGSMNCGEGRGMLGADELPDVCTLTAANLISDGGFETPAILGAPYEPFGAGDSIGAWLVQSGAIDLVTSDYWIPASGAQSVDLDGSCGVGTIAQAVAPDSGHSYRICFAIAGNPDGPPSMKPVEIWWGGSRIDSFAVDARLSRRENLRWRTRQYVVTAPSSMVTLEFRSATPGCYGPIVDNVVVQEVAAPIP